MLLAGPATAYRDLARASVVLLRPTRPDPAVLPIPTDGGVRLCVLGPLADQEPEDWLGAYSSHANRHLERVTTPLAGIRRHWPEAAYARGCDYDATAASDGGELAREAAEAARLAREATHVVLFLGEPHKWSGESATLAEPRLPLVQRRLVQKVRRANPGAKLIVFVTAGRALHIPREVEENADAIFWTAHLGTFAGDAIADILAGVASPTARLSHGLPIADGITSGFDSRQARIDRPPVPVVPGSAARRQRHHWCAYYLGLGARWPAAYYFGEGYGYTSFALSDWSLSDRTLSASAGTPDHRQRAGDQHRQPGRHRDGAPLLPGHGVRGAGPAAPGAPRPPAGDARSGRVRDAGLHGRAGDARQVRPRPRCRPAGLARPEPGGEPDRLFLVQHEGQALDAIERFGDAPCVLAFELVP